MLATFLKFEVKKQSSAPYIILSISEQHRLLALPKPHHPLVSVFNFADIKNGADEMSKNFILNFYCIAIKRGIQENLNTDKIIMTLMKGFCLLFRQGSCYQQLLKTKRRLLVGVWFFILILLRSTR